MASGSHKTLTESAKDLADDFKVPTIIDVTLREISITNKPKMEKAHNESKEDLQKEGKPDVDENNEKKLKKKQKKQRQREKKKSERSDTNDVDAKQQKENMDDLKNYVDEDGKVPEKVDAPVDKDSNASKKLDAPVDEEANDEEEINETEEFDFVNGAAAFVNAVRKKGNKKLNPKIDKANAKVTSMGDSGSGYNAISNNYNDNHNDNQNECFVFVKGKRTKLPNAQGSSLCLGIKAIELIMKNKILLAIERLSTAIQQDPFCVDHYVNRSFCYLRSKQYPLAIADAQHVLQNSQETKTVMKVKYILGQAYCCVKNFRDAEKRLTECLSVIPHNIYFQRELARLKVTQLTSLGFSERDVLLAFEDCVSVMDAIDMLLQNSPCSTKDSLRAEDYVFDEDEVYYSDEDPSDSGRVM